MGLPEKNTMYKYSNSKYPDLNNKKVRLIYVTQQKLIIRFIDSDLISRMYNEAKQKRKNNKDDFSINSYPLLDIRKDELIKRPRIHFNDIKKFKNHCSEI